MRPTVGRRTGTRHGRPWALVALAILALTTALAGCRSTAATDQRSAGPPRATAPPWSAPAHAVLYIRAAGLPALSAEALKVHFHAHLDVLVDGRAVPVPAFLGVDLDARKISPLHTHDSSGIVHVEAPRPMTITLGQVFTEWDVRLDEHCVGSLCEGSGKSLRLYVGGRLRPGDPRTLVLARHQEIALVYGDAAVQPPVPSSYAFPSVR